MRLVGTCWWWRALAGIAAAAVLAGGGALSVATLAAEPGTRVSPLKVTLAGYSPGGASAAVGQAIGKAILAEVPGSVFSYEPGMSGANEIKVSRGETTLGLSSSLLVRAAAAGTAPYATKYGNLRGIAFLHTSDVQFIFDKRSGIRSMRDLLTRPTRLATNTKNSFMELTVRAALQAAGTSYEDIERRGGKVFFTTMRAALEQMRNRQVNVIGMATLSPTALLIEASNTPDLGIFTLDDETIRKTNELVGSRTVVIPKDTYPFQTADLKSAGMDNILITRAELPERTAYIITKALYNHLEAMHEVSVVLKKQMTRQNMADVGRGVTLHPGAERFYREVGVLK